MQQGLPYKGEHGAFGGVTEDGVLLELLGTGLKPDCYLLEENYTSEVNWKIFFGSYHVQVGQTLGKDTMHEIGKTWTWSLSMKSIVFLYVWSIIWCIFPNLIKILLLIQSCMNQTSLVLSEWLHFVVFILNLFCRFPIDLESPTPVLWMEFHGEQLNLIFERQFKMINLRFYSS